MANETKYYKTPFGENGSRAEIPNESNSNNVNYDEGFTSDYELPQGDANRKTIPRTGTNQLYNDITKNLKQWQEQNYPTWIEENGEGDFYAYDKNIIVFYNGSAWISLEDENDDEPSVTSSKWLAYEPVAKSTNNAALQVLTDNVATNADHINNIKLDGLYAYNLLSASQPIVQSVTGSTLPSGTATNYADGDEIAFGYYADGAVTNLKVDGFSNLVLSNPATDTGKIYIECDIPTNKSITDLFGSVITGSVSGITTTSFTNASPEAGLNLSLVGGKARLTIDLALLTDGAFAFGISEKSGGVNIDIERDILDKLCSRGICEAAIYDVTADRSENTLYTNNRPWPINVSVYTLADNSQKALALFVDGLRVDRAVIGAGTSNSSISVGFEVPAYAEYYIVGDFDAWIEKY